MPVSNKSEVALRLDVRRAFAADAGNYEEMCSNHLRRSRLLHELLSRLTVSAWGETDIPCADSDEPPIAVFVDVTLSVDSFIDIVRGAAAGLAGKRIAGMYIRPSGSLGHRYFGDHVVFNVAVQGQLIDVRVDSLTDEQLRDVFEGKFPSVTSSGE